MEQEVDLTITANQSGSYKSTLVWNAFPLPPDDDLQFPLLLDKERGGIGLNDPSEGLNYQDWTLRYFGASKEFVISAPNTANTVIHTVTGVVSEISLAFDQNMNPFIAYVEDGDAKYYWWDVSINQYVVTNLPANTLTPRCCIDDKRDFAAGAQVSDVILCYVNGGALYWRQERERYDTSRIVEDPFLHPDFGLPAVLKRVCKLKNNRLGWICDLANPIDWCGYVNNGN